MRKYTVSLTILIFLSAFPDCFSQPDNWKLISSGNALFSLNNLSIKSSWIFGGTVAYKSNDGGKSWGLPIVMNPPVGFTGGKSIFFIDSLTGWACQNNNVLLKTTNGGNNWFSFNTGLPSQSLIEVNFINSMTGWVAGDRLYKTTNGGNNWIQILNLFNGIASIRLINQNTGFAISNMDTLGKTTNGGTTWELQKISNNQNVSRQLRFSDSSNGWVLDNPNSVFRTTNSGINWIEYSAPFGNSSDLLFINSLTGWITVSGSSIFKSTNGGQNWFNQLNNSRHPIGYMSFKDIDTGWALTNKGSLLKTKNGGSNWDIQISPPLGNIKKIEFFNTDTGYCICNYSPVECSVWKTTNKGVYWDMKFSLPFGMNEIEFNDLQIINENNVVVAGKAGIFISSTNGGQTWNSFSQQNLNLNGTHFINNQTGWVCGSAGTIMRTSNAGLNFTNQNSGTSKKINDIYFSNPNDGYAVTDSGYFLKTTNSGENWSVIQLGNQELSKINFIDSQTGFIMGNRIVFGMVNNSRNVIYKTTNAGNSWELIVNETFSAVGLTKYFNDVNFLNSNLGYIVMMDGQIRKTENGGVNWTNISSPVQRVYSSIFLLNENYGWIAGDYGTVISTTPSVGIVNLSSSVPIKINLKQNYPNPFNPNTNIEFSILKSSLAKLIIYDITGREVTRLVNEVLSTGTYKVTWDAYNYPSGIYYYKLILDDYAETKKMVLVK